MSAVQKSTLFKEVYKDLPSDPRELIANSKMVHSPEVTLEDFLNDKPDREYEQYALSTGANLKSEYKAKPLSRLKLDQKQFEMFMQENMEHCEKKYYEKTYQAGVN